MALYFHSIASKAYRICIQQCQFNGLGNIPSNQHNSKQYIDYILHTTTHNENSNSKHYFISDIVCERGLSSDFWYCVLAYGHNDPFNIQMSHNSDEQNSNGRKIMNNNKILYMYIVHASFSSNMFNKSQRNHQNMSAIFELKIEV